MARIVAYVTDVHGEVEKFEELFRAGSGKNVAAVIIGGDITPFVMFAGEDNIELQRDFLKSYLIPRIKKFHNDYKKPVFVIMGNDDFKVNYDLLIKAEKNGTLKLLNQKVCKFAGWCIAGYTFVNPTPFLIKDWEKNEEKIKEDLEKLGKELKGCRKTIFVFHAPPFRTSLDMIYSGEHVGSRSIKEFIEKFQPDLTFHGHIHESPEVSGSYSETIGKTISINPGNGRITIVDIEKPSQIFLS